MIKLPSNKDGNKTFHKDGRSGSVYYRTSNIDTIFYAKQQSFSNKHILKRYISIKHIRINIKLLFLSVISEKGSKSETFKYLFIFAILDSLVISFNIDFLKDTDNTLITVKVTDLRIPKR